MMARFIFGIFAVILLIITISNAQFQYRPLKPFSYRDYYRMSRYWSNARSPNYISGGTIGGGGHALRPGRFESGNDDKGGAAEQHPECDENAYWNHCATSCPDNCQNHGRPRACTLNCRAACSCNIGYVFAQGDSGKCIPIDQCPIEQSTGIKGFGRWPGFVRRPTNNFQQNRYGIKG